MSTGSTSLVRAIRIAMGSTTATVALGSVPMALSAAATRNMPQGRNQSRPRDSRTTRRTTRSIAPLRWAWPNMYITPRIRTTRSAGNPASTSSLGMPAIADITNAAGSTTSPTLTSRHIARPNAETSRTTDNTSGTDMRALPVGDSSIPDTLFSILR